MPNNRKLLLRYTFVYTKVYLFCRDDMQSINGPKLEYKNKKFKRRSREAMKQ